MLGLGSNLGEREENLKVAVLALGRKLELIAVSSVYETEPMYLEDQAWFLNCVVVCETELSPRALLAWLKQTERRIGREPGERNTPRLIDIDILFYGGKVVSSTTLEIPHPKVAERAFVLVPLNEVKSGLVHPVLRKTVAEMLSTLKTDKKVFKRPGLLAGVSLSTPRRRGLPAASPSRRES